MFANPAPPSTPDWNKDLVIWPLQKPDNDLSIGIRCAGAGTHLKHAGWGAELGNSAWGGNCDKMWQIQLDLTARQEDWNEFPGCWMPIVKIQTKYDAIPRESGRRNFIRDAARRLTPADKSGPALNGSLASACRRAAAGTEERETGGLGRKPSQTQEVSGGGGGSECVRQIPPPPPPLPLHSAPHLKALVMHSSSPATRGVIEFPRQWDRVKFHLHLGVLSDMLNKV